MRSPSRRHDRYNRPVVFDTDPQLTAIAGLVHGFTDRHGGVSTAKYATLNMASKWGDDLGAVAEVTGSPGDPFAARPGLADDERGDQLGEVAVIVHVGGLPGVIAGLEQTLALRQDHAVHQRMKVVAPLFGGLLIDGLDRQLSLRGARRPRPKGPGDRAAPGRVAADRRYVHLLPVKIGGRTSPALTTGGPASKPVGCGPPPDTGLWTRCERSSPG